jgi:opacity protein-like surface antigen
MLRTARRLVPPALACLLLPFVPLAAEAAGPRQVRIALDARVTLQRVLAAGLDVVESRPGASVDVLEWPGDQATIAALGAALEVVDADPGLHAAEHARAELAAAPRPALRRVLSAARGDGVFRAEAYPPAGSGSLGGFWTLAEIKMKLDDLVASDVNDVVANRIDTLGYSVQGRPVWGLKLGRTVAGPDTRPVAFFNALTHSREPGGMQALFYFVDDLLAHYGTDPVATYLLDARQIYVVPVVNPDGYAFNQRIYDSTATFGLWRKNLRDSNLNGTTGIGDGVDINRNFGFNWGFNDTGSSPTPTSDTYRGPAAWSEPETRIQRDLVAALRPSTGFSFHTYSDLFVHPWGWTPLGTPDSLKFQTWSDEFAITNGFAAGPGPRILYAVNGEFSDWTYGDTLLKPRAFTWTPEVGSASDGFWPPPSRMTAISQSVLRPCYQVAGAAGPWVRVERASLLEGALAAGNLAHLVVRARNLGASGQAGPGLEASLTALDAGIEVSPGVVRYPALGSFESADPQAGGSFLVAAVDTVTPGRMVRFRVDFTDASGLFARDTVELVVGAPTVVTLDPCETLAGWTVVAGGWGITAGDPVHPDAYLADSPAGLYPSRSTAQLVRGTTLDLSAGVHAWLLFEDRWGFEQDYDAGLVEASLDGVTWQTLRGNGTVRSVSLNVAGAGRDILGGTRWRWRNDRFDLSSFAGGAAAGAVRLRLRALSDSGTNFDGLAVDSLRVVLYDPAQQPAPVAVGRGPRPVRLLFAPPSPNPARGTIAFAFETPDAGTLSLEILDLQGRRVHERTHAIAQAADGAPYASRFLWGWDLRDDAGRRVAPGLYLARLRSPSGEAVRRFIVLP